MRKLKNEVLFNVGGYAIYPYDKNNNIMNEESEDRKYIGCEPMLFGCPPIDVERYSKSLVHHGIFPSMAKARKEAKRYNAKLIQGLTEPLPCPQYISYKSKKIDDDKYLFYTDPTAEPQYYTEEEIDLFKKGRYEETELLIAKVHKERLSPEQTKKLLVETVCVIKYENFVWSAAPMGSGELWLIIGVCDIRYLMVFNSDRHMTHFNCESRNS